MIRAIAEQYRSPGGFSRTISPHRAGSDVIGEAANGADAVAEAFKPGLLTPEKR